MITYKIYRNGVLIASDITDTSYQVEGLNPSTRYEFTVVSVDENGNESNPSEIAEVRTLQPSDIVPPSVIADLAATADSSSAITLTWSAATDTVGVSGYRIKRNGVEIDTTELLTYTDRGLAAGTLYFYTVAAYDAVPNFADESNTASAMTDAATDSTAPTVPTGLTVTVTGSTTLLAEWTASTDAVGVTGYNVYVDGVLFNDTTDTFLSITALSPSTAYDITVSAFDAAANESAQCAAVTGTTSSGADVTAPTVPANLAATAASESQIDLAWDVSTDAVGVAGYNIYRNGVKIDTSATNSYSDTGLLASTSYTYTVSAFDAAGNTSAQSASDSATTNASADVTAPTIPTALTATVVSSSQINLSWTASSDAVGVAGYKIFRGSNSAGKIGFVGASISQYTVLGAETLGSTRFWDDNLGYGGGGVYKWAQNLTNTNTYWSRFNTAYQANPTTTIWFQLCAVDTDAANETNANALAVCNEIKARVPGVTIYVSAQPDYVAGPCSIAGAAGPARMDSLVSYLVGLADPQILAGPVFPDLLASEVQADGCHQDADGQATDGQILIDFFNTVGLTQIGTSATASFQNTGLTANTQYTYAVSAYDAAGNESQVSASVTARTQTGTGTAEKRALGIYAVRGPRDSTLIVNKDFVDGVVFRTGWGTLNTADGVYNFSSITSMIDQVTAVDQYISLVVFVIEPPSWVMNNVTLTWTNNFATRQPTQPLPWDTYVLGKWETFWQALGDYVYEGYQLRNHPRIKQVDCGIVGLQGVRFITAPTHASSPYSYATFEAAVKRGLHAVADQFPSKHLYYGLFGTGTGAQSGDAKKIRDALITEFNGIDYPRMGVYQETWTGEVPTAATGQLLYDVRNQAAAPAMLQACGEYGNQSAWGQCNFATNDTVQGASTYAINNFNCTYLEIYNSDLNAAGNATIMANIRTQLQTKYDSL
jgi:chitodextrinase